MGDVRNVLVPDGLEGERVDAAVSRLFGLSRTRVADLAAEGKVLLEGATVAKSARVSAGDRIEVTGTISGLPGNSTHGFHVHETGDCSAPDGTSAGGHFNPASTDHGRVGQGEHHAGDSDNITADADGNATVQGWLEGATVGDGAATDIVGKAVIVHADEDDYATQPTGNAGDRLACGVIAAR